MHEIFCSIHCILHKLENIIWIIGMASVLPSTKETQSHTDTLIKALPYVGPTSWRDIGTLYVVVRTQQGPDHHNVTVAEACQLECTSRSKFATCRGILILITLAVPKSKYDIWQNAQIMCFIQVFVPSKFLQYYLYLEAYLLGCGHQGKTPTCIFYFALPFLTLLGLPAWTSVTILLSN